MRVGIDVGSYIFTPGIAGVGTITLIDIPFTVSLNQLQIVYNVTDGISLFNFASSSTRATISDNIITLLDIDSSSMNASDDILIQLAEKNDRIQLGDILFQLKRIFVAIVSPTWFDKVTNTVKSTAVISSGTVTTVSTVATVSSMTNLGAFSSEILVKNQNMAAWYSSVRGRIS